MKTGQAGTGDTFPVCTYASFPTIFIFALDVVFAAIIHAVRFAVVLVEMFSRSALGAEHAFSAFDFIDALACAGDAFCLEALVFLADAAGTVMIIDAFLLVVDHIASAGHPAGLF